MKKIEKTKYKNFYDIFKELYSYSFLLSALDGIVESTLYADDDENPTYALMLTADLNYIAGDLSGDQVKSDLFSFTQSDDFPDKSGFLFASRHFDRIEEIFGYHIFKLIKRNNFRLSSSNVDSDEEYVCSNIVKVTPENICLYESYENYEEVFGECMFYWNEYPEDAKTIFANILVEDDKIASFCYLCGESSSEMSSELGIKTFEGFRRKGYAELLSRVALKDLSSKGFKTFNWHCHVDNLGSINTARKLGFNCIDESYLALFKKKLD